MTKRLCLFAGYSKHNVIEDYVVYYLKELSKYADIFYCADCNISAQELQKIKPYVKCSVAQRHHKYDFGSWEISYKNVSNLAEYDELILANDSVFGPLFPLDKVFASMEGKDVSAWGLCGNKFMMSFFIVLRKDVFLTPWFAEFITNIKDNIDKNDIVRLYEKGITQIVEEHGLKWDCVFSKKNLLAQFNDNRDYLKKELKTIPFSIRFWHRYRPNKARVYDDDFFILFLLGMPFIKKKSFEMDHNHFDVLAPLFITKYSDYDYDLIKRSLELNNIFRIRTPLGRKILKSIKSFFFEKKYKGRGIVYKVFKIEVFVKKHELTLK